VTDLIVVSQTAHWQRLKLLVLDSVSSPITRRVYNLGLNEFFEWYGSEPRPGFTKATVSAWEYNRVVVTLRAPRTIVWPCLRIAQPPARTQWAQCTPLRRPDTLGASTDADAPGTGN
jgi:hypothetical protein